MIFGAAAEETGAVTTTGEVSRVTVSCEPLTEKKLHPRYRAGVVAASAVHRRHRCRRRELVVTVRSPPSLKGSTIDITRQQLSCVPKLHSWNSNTLNPALVSVLFLCFLPGLIIGLWITVLVVAGLSFEKGIIEAEVVVILAPRELMP